MPQFESFFMYFELYSFLPTLLLHMEQLKSNKIRFPLFDKILVI